MKIDENMEIFPTKLKMKIMLIEIYTLRKQQQQDENISKFFFYIMEETFSQKCKHIQQRFSRSSTTKQKKNTHS